MYPHVPYASGGPGKGLLGTPMDCQILVDDKCIRLTPDLLESIALPHIVEVSTPFIECVSRYLSDMCIYASGMLILIE